MFIITSPILHKLNNNFNAALHYSKLIPKTWFIYTAPACELREENDVVCLALYHFWSLKFQDIH